MCGVVHPTVLCMGRKILYLGKYQLLQLQQLSALTPDTGDSNFLFRKSVKSGRDRMDGDDYRRTYVCWPKKSCFIGPDRHRVCYDELSHPQWAAGIASIAANQPSNVICSLILL